MSVTRFRSKLNSSSDLLFLCCITVLLFPIVIFSGPVIVRAVFALPAVLFFPGYTLISALYPKRENMTGMERLLLSFGLSMAVVALMGFIMNYMWSVALFPTLISLTIFIFTMSVVAWFRRRQVSDIDLFNPVLLAPFKFKIPRIRWNYRIALWIILVGLSAIISFFPVNIKLDASAIQSLGIFSNLRVFAAVFIIWMAVLLLLLVTNKEGSKWEKLALVCVFVWVFRNFWVLITPDGFHPDTFGHLGMVRLLDEFGRIPPGQANYWGFPGFHLFANSLIQASGLNIFQASQFIILFENLIYTALLFKMSSNLLKSPYFASFATMIVLMTVPIVQHFEFIPHTFAAVLALAFIVILTREENRMFSTMQDRLMAIILFIAAAMCVFWYPMLLFFILLGKYLTQLRTKEKTIELPLVLFALIVVVAWQIFYAPHFFNILSNYVPTIMNNFLSGAMFSTSLQRVASISAVSVPLWAQLTQYFWILAIAGLGTLIGLVRLTQIKKLSPLETLDAAAILGTILFFIIVFALSREGYYVANYITLVRIFSAVLIVRFMLWVGGQLKKRLKLKMPAEKISIFLLVGVIFAVSLPSFLVEGKDISTFTIYPQEIAAGKYLQSLYGDGADLRVFTNQPEVPDVVRFYLPDAIAHDPAEYYTLPDKAALFKNMDNLVADFEQKNKFSIFVFSEKTLLGTNQTYGIALDDPYWIKMKNSLAGFVGTTNVWSNDYYTIYINP